MKARLVVLLLLSTSLSSAVILPETARATTLYVGGAGLGNYTTIQDAINASSSGNTVYIYNGIYLENIIVNRSISLVGGGNMTIIDGGDKGDAIRITSDSVTLTHLAAIRGGDRSTDAAIELYHVNSCLLEDVAAHWGYYGILLLSSSDNVMTNVTVFSTAIAGIRLSNSDYNTLTASRVYDNAYGVLLENSDDNMLDGNLLTNNGNAFDLESSEANVIRDNEIVENLYTGVSLGGSSWNAIVRNDISSRWGISLETSSNRNSIRNNTLRGGGISVHESDVNTISGNEVSGGDYGIKLWSSLVNTITENDLSNNSESGIVLISSDHNDIRGNAIALNGMGIGCLFSNSNSFEGNDIRENAASGINLTSCNENALLGNDIAENGEDGIFLDDSHDNEIAENTIARNEGYGIRLQESNGNEIRDNTLVDNEIIGLPVSEESWAWIIIPVVGIAVILVVAAFLWLRKRKKVAAEAVEPDE